MWKRPKIRFINFLAIFLAANLAGCQFGFKYQDPTNQRGVGVYHTLQPGQTLYELSLAYHVDLEQLKRVNDIQDPSKVQVGQHIWIPNAYNVLKIPENDKGRQVAKKKSPPPGNPFAVT